jgi:TDG/mug DNA glycosylase family protein
LIRLGYGITNLVERATATADELAAHELVEGGRRVVDKVLRFEPKVLAVVGITAYRTAFKRPGAALGLQEDRIGETAIWVLPNPSGLNAHLSLDGLAQVYGELRKWVDSYLTKVSL